MIASLTRHIEHFLWHPPTVPGSPLHLLQRVLRFPYALLRDALEGEMTMRAMSLVYTTMLSIVPFLALSFSILKAFDVHYQVAPLLENFLAPLGPRGDELSAKVIGFVDQQQGVALGSAGLILLIFTVVSMVQKVEESLNYVWQVEQTRSIGRRLSEYLAIIIVAPPLMLLALGSLGAISSHSIVEKMLAAQWIKESYVAIGKLTPLALVTLIFSFFYATMPNTRVRPVPALLGGLAAGLMWTAMGALFAAFVAGSGRFTAVYSTFAIVIVALIWIYISWLILLIGAKVSFYIQKPEYLRHGHKPLLLNNAMRERIALALMTIVARDYRNTDQRWELNDLALSMGLPGRAVAPIAKQLERRGLLVTSDNDLLLPGKALDKITISAILAAVREQPKRQPHFFVPADDCVNGLLDTIERAIDSSVGQRTLQDLLAEEERTAEV